MHLWTRVFILIAISLLTACTRTPEERIESRAKFEVALHKISIDTVNRIFKYCWSNTEDFGNAVPTMLADGYQETTSPNSQFKRRIFKKSKTIMTIANPAGKEYNFCATRYGIVKQRDMLTAFTSRFDEMGISYNVRKVDKNVNDIYVDSKNARITVANNAVNMNINTLKFISLTN